MGLKKAVKKGLFSGVKPKEWLGFNDVKSGGAALKNIIKSNKRSRGPAWESFEKFMHANNLTQSDVDRLARLHNWIALGCCAASLFLLYYMFHLLFTGAVISGLITFMLTLYALAYAYAESMKAFKLKQRILSTTFSQWFQNIFHRRRS